MKLFTCQSCQQVLYFESVQCTRCGHALAYLPDRALVSAIEPRPAPPSKVTSNPAAAPAAGGAGNAAGAAGNGSWRSLAPGAEGTSYRLCRNYTDNAVCNWAIPESDADEYCQSCRLNHIIPNLSNPQAHEAWHRMEVAKRRLLFTLMGLGLPVESKAEEPERGLAFDFLQDGVSADAPKVFTGHSDGLITINIAEADDPLREKMRAQLGEAYRTVLGHFRHESGHYYWARLVENSPSIDGFRKLFGDDRADYDVARKRHYEQGPPPNWSERFVSAYASMHPWEDWAETWAHYLHMVDGLETARAYGLTLRPEVPAPPEGTALAARRLNLHSFDDLMKGWIPLTIALNSLNRSFGTNDVYPFVLAPAVVEKLGFVHEVVARGAAAASEKGEAAAPARVAPSASSPPPAG
jgi:hypothetical protein